MSRKPGDESPLGVIQLRETKSVTRFGEADSKQFKLVLKLRTILMEAPTEEDVEGCVVCGWAYPICDLLAGMQVDQGSTERRCFSKRDGTGG